MILPWAAVLGWSSPIPTWVRLVAGALWVLCLMPAWLYLGRPVGHRDPIPFLPLIGVLFALYYPLSVTLGSFNRYHRINVDPVHDYDAPVVLAFVGWCALLLGYGIARPYVSRRVSGHISWDARVVQRWGVSLLFLGLSVEALRRSVGVPIAIAGLTHFVSSLAYFGIGLLTYLLCRGKLDHRGKILFLWGLVMTVGILLATGMLALLVPIPLVILFAVWLGRGAFDLRWVFAAVAIAVVLIGVKSVIAEYRTVVWTVTNDRSMVGQIGVMFDLMGRQVGERGFSETATQGMDALTIRSTLTDLFADVVRRTPTQIEFWNGQSYMHLVGMAVPRFLWPGKPVHRLGQAFGHAYGYLDPHDTWTSSNLPFLIEFYVNFGDWGVVLGMLLVGVIYAVLCGLMNNPGQSPLISIAGIVLFLKLINVESDFSVQFGALLMHGVAIWMVLRTLSRRSRRGDQPAGADARELPPRGAALATIGGQR